VTTARGRAADLGVHLRRARDHVDRHFADDLDLDRLARVAGVRGEVDLGGTDRPAPSNPGEALRRSPSGGGFRRVTVFHPSRPELEIALMTPGPPLDEDAAAFVRGQLEKGSMGGLVLVERRELTPADIA
jgi:hypothetical protein